MITKKGKLLLSKYMLGINPTFATHVAIGCGDDSLPTSREERDENYFRNNLQFETCRIPIVSRGVVNENGQNKIVFKAELPIEKRYGVTEIGLFSENRNVRAGQFDSKTICEFNGPLELWYKINKSNIISALDVVSSLSSGGNILPTNAGSAVPVCYTYTNNSLWTEYTARKKRKESPRFGNGCVMMRGDYSNLTYSANNSTWNWDDQNYSGDKYGIETSTIGLNMAKNSPNDEVRIAFSLASRALGGYSWNDIALLDNIKVNIWMDFLNEYSNTDSKKARAKKSIFGSITNTSDTYQPYTYQDATRYIVHSFKKSDFETDEGFSWASINGIRIFASVQDGLNASSDYWIVFDGIRLENVSTESPTYGMVAYTQVFTDDELPLVKSENTTNFIEFRMLID